MAMLLPSQSMWREVAVLFMTSSFTVGMRAYTLDIREIWIRWMSSSPYTTLNYLLCDVATTLLLLNM